MAQRDVTVTFNSSTKNISVSPDPVQVKKAVDGVTWAGAHQFAIVINGRSTSSTGSGSQWSLTLGPWPDAGTIKYDVTASGYNDLDPDIEVLP